MTFFHLLTLVTYLILSLFISSLEAAGVLRNATLHDNDLMSISRFSYGWRQVAHPGAIGGEHAYNRQAGGWVEVELPGEHNPQPLINAFLTISQFQNASLRYITSASRIVEARNILFASTVTPGAALNGLWN